LADARHEFKPIHYGHIKFLELILRGSTPESLVLPVLIRSRLSADFRFVHPCRDLVQFW
jgi:hypothetical protein